MPFTTKTDAYLQKLDSTLRTTIPYMLTDTSKPSVVKKSVVAFTGNSLSVYNLEKLVEVVNGENNYFLEETNSGSYTSPKIYFVVKKVNSFTSKTVLSFEQKQLPLVYSSKRFADLINKKQIN